jgi:hypothetical protein
VCLSLFFFYKNRSENQRETKVRYNSHFLKEYINIYLLTPSTPCWTLKCVMPLTLKSRTSRTSSQTAPSIGMHIGSDGSSPVPWPSWSVHSSEEYHLIIRTKLHPTQTIIISAYSVRQHARHYHRPAEQRQIIVSPSFTLLINWNLVCPSLTWMLASPAHYPHATRLWSVKSLVHTQTTHTLTPLNHSTAIISFFSYRFFRAFTYYQLVETVSRLNLS